MNGLVEACAAERTARDALKLHNEESAKRKQQLETELSTARERVLLCNAGLDEAKIAVARQVLYRSGKYANSPQRKSAVQDMVDWLATGEKRTYYAPTTGYFGVKNYSGFGDQREDHEYGFGPKHGSIVFAVGLNERKRELTDDEREAALYYLINIDAIEAARTSAREAA